MAQKQDQSTELKRLNLRLFGVALLANLTSFIAGNAFLWTSPVLPKLNGHVDPESNPFGYPISAIEGSWIASLLSLGACVGPVIGGACVNRIGRKRTLLLLAIPMSISFLITAFAASSIYFYFARFILGLGVGCVYSVVPMYVAEISEDTNRGAMGCLLGVMYCVGALFSLVVGPYVSIKIFSLLSLIPLAAFVLIFGIYAPESPYYFVSIGNDEEARSALRKVRTGNDQSVDKELLKVVEEIENSVSNSQNQSLCDILKNRIVRKGLTISVGLMVCQQITAIVALSSYMQSIFETAGNTIPADLSAIAAGIVQLLANFLVAPLVDRLVRKFLLILSLSLTSVSHAALGLYFFFKASDYDVSSIFWLPTASVMLFYLAYNLGMGSIIWVVAGELFPSSAKSVAMALVSFTNLLMAFLISLLFPSVVALVGMSASFWFFTFGCVVCVVFVVVVVPETKGKSLQEIQIMLGEGRKT